MTSKPFTLKEGIFKDLSSSDYHGERNSFSSSQIKVAMVDRELFYDTYIERSVETEHIAAFDTGTGFHTAVLEPEKFEKEIKVYPGKRIGKNWEAFKGLNEGAVILTETQANQVKTLAKAVQESPLAMSRIEQCNVEVSAFLEILVHRGEIFCNKGSMILGKYGWEPNTKDVPVKGKPGVVSMFIKARCDGMTLNKSKRFILDLKSMSGNAKLKYEIKNKISGLNYDLSASLYLDIFSAVLKQPYRDFIWIFASKDKGNCKSYLASNDNVLIGRAKWKKGVLEIAAGLSCDWKFEDTLEILEPNLFEYAHLKEPSSDEDL